MNKRILFLVNHDIVIYNFRKELVKELILNKYEVYISCPNGENISKLVYMGAKHIELKINRHGINPFRELKLILHYSNIVKKISPNVILSYTIKPNIYGGVVSRLYKIPFVANITGLGSAVENKSLMQKITLFMYKIGLKRAEMIYFQNIENMTFMINHNIVRKGFKLIPGSGVNLEEFQYFEYPKEDKIIFLYIGRIMKEKGIDFYLSASKFIKEKYPYVDFYVLGFCEENYINILEDYQKNGYITYYGRVNNVYDYIKKSNCLIHPTYYPEGMSNVLLESAATGRPIITTNRSGCKEIVDDKITGFLVEPKKQKELNDTIEKFINLSIEEKVNMGKLGREKVEKEFNREFVLNEYMTLIKNILGD